MGIVVELEWRFTPSNYFEKELEISRPLYTMTISDGRVKAKMDSEIYKENPTIREQLHEDLNARFLAAQLLTHKPYNLSLIRTQWLHPDGHNDIEIGLIGSGIKLSAGTLDHRITDPNGNIISDSKKDRIEKTVNFIELVAKHKTDSLLTRLLKSYEEAVGDTSNEFLHLYEIRDALTMKFGNEDNVRKTLGITKSEFSNFRGLCNNKDLNEGRHRGQNNDISRNASEEELEKVRGLAQLFITKYINYLENKAFV